MLHYKYVLEFEEVMNKNYQISVLILIGILFLSIITMPVPFVLADPANYTLEAQKKDATWTNGLVSGYVGCEKVPFRLTATYGNPDKGETFTIKIWGASIDTDTPTNDGIDYLADFTYVDNDGIIVTGPTINGNSFPWAGGAGTGTLVTQSNGVQNREYNLTFTLNSTYSGNPEIIFYWGAHLALSPFGAAEWIGPPSTNIQGGATPPSGGVKTVNIQTPGSITTAATTDTTTETTETTTDTTTETTETTTDTTTETTETTSDTTTKTIETTETIEDHEDPFESAPVGGYIIPVNKLLVILPYIVILGMIACLLTIIRMNLQRRDQNQK
jgi:hypothetical protein